MKKYMICLFMATVGSLSFAQSTRVSGDDSDLQDPDIQGKPRAIEITGGRVSGDTPLTEFTLEPTLGDLEIKATVLPQEGMDQRIEWSVTDGAEYVKWTIQDIGIIRLYASAIRHNGTVYLRATSVKDPTVYTEVPIILRNYIIPVSSVSITCDKEVIELTPTQRELHLKSEILPEDATDKAIIWDIVSGIDLATISKEGVLTVKDINVDGMVTVRLSMKNNTNIRSEITIPVRGFVVKASSITVSTQESDAVITPSQTSLHLQVTVLPVNTTDKSIVWTLVSGGDLVTLSSEGLLSANGSKKNGTVVVRAIAKDGSEAYGELSVTVKNFVVEVSSVVIHATEETVELTPTQRELHLGVIILPEDATNKSVVWSIIENNTLASITQNGILSVGTTNLNGSVKVRATAKDGSGQLWRNDSPCK